MIHDVFCLTRIRNSKTLHNPFFGRRRNPIRQESTGNVF